MFKHGTGSNDSHDYVEAQLSDYVDGRLPAAERARVRQHLQTCERCRASLRSLGWTINLLKQTPAPALPRQFTLPVPEARAARGGAPWLKWGLVAASLAAAFVFVMLLTTDLLTQGPGGSTSNTTFVSQAPAALTPTSAPPAADQIAAQATNAPIPELSLPTQVPAVVPAATQAPSTVAARVALPVTPTAKAAQPTATPRAANSGASVLPSPTPSCVGCGGGIAEETPSTFNVQPATSSEVASGTITSNNVAVLEAADRKATRIGSLKRGAEVKVLSRDETGGWLQIVYPIDNDQGLYGWVLSRFVKLDLPLKSLPVTSSPEALTPASQRSSLAPGTTSSPAPANLHPLATAPATTVPPEALPPTDTPSPTDTLSPTATPSPSATPSPTPTVTRSPSPTPRATQTPTATRTAIVTPIIPPAPALASRGNQVSTLRLGEIAALIASLVFGAIALIVIRRG